MDKEYKGMGGDNFDVSEFHQPREQVDSSKKEFSEPCHEYYIGKNEFAQDIEETFVTDADKEDEKRHKRLVKKMAYVVASAATIVTVSQTPDSPKEESKAKVLIENDIYAYGDLNGDQRIDDVDMQLGLATELCQKYFWEEGGMLDETFGISKPSDLEERIVITADGTYPANQADGTQDALDQYTYQIRLGDDAEGNPVEATGHVYALRSNNDILVYDGSEFYIRDLATDKVAFNRSTGDDEAICVVADFKTVEDFKINGNGGGSYENINPADSSVFTVSLWNEDFVSKFKTYYTDSGLTDYHSNREVCTKLRMMKPNKTYVAIRKNADEGEPKRVPGIHFDTSDSICETGDNKYVEVFAGDDILHINPISGATGLTNTGIIDVSLSEASQAAGNVITKIADDDYEIKLGSKDYAGATVDITYADGTTRSLTIQQQTLAISYQYLGDQGEGVRTYNLLHGGDPSSTFVEYNYYDWQQVIIYATYYHPSNAATAGEDNNALLYVADENGSVRTIEPLKYTEATDDIVATTDYLIDFVPAKEQNPDGTWGKPLDYISLTPMHAYVGNEPGVYWDGIIRWNY